VSYHFLLNPVVLLPQLKRVMSAGDLSGISVLTFWGFALLQALTFFVATAAAAIKPIAMLVVDGARPSRAGAFKDVAETR